MNVPAYACISVKFWKMDCEGDGVSTGVGSSCMRLPEGWHDWSPWLCRTPGLRYMYHRCQQTAKYLTHGKSKDKEWDNVQGNLKDFWCYLLHATTSVPASRFSYGWSTRRGNDCAHARLELVTWTSQHHLPGHLLSIICLAC